MSVALVIFCLDEVERVLVSISSMLGIVDEMVVIDSSPPIEHGRLLHRTKTSGVKIYHVVPIGFPEPLRPFGLSKVDSDYALILDADEEITDPLKDDLRDLNEFEAYVLPRLEAGLGSYTFHLRLLRPSAVGFSKRSFDFPDVRGRIGRLGKSHRIVHHADFANYLSDKGREERYFAIENAERPFTRQYLQEALTIRLGNRSVSLDFASRLGERPDAPLSHEMTRGAVEIEFIRDLVLGKSLRAASFNRRYSLEKERFLLGLSNAERDFFRAAARGIRESGGIFPYLGFADPTYVERLTDSFNWELSGAEVYKRLLRYRLRHGRPAEHVPRRPDGLE